MNTSSILSFLSESCADIFSFSGSPMLVGSLDFAAIFIVFLLVYVLLKKSSRIAMMAYVILFNLFFAYKANGLAMFILPATALVNYFLVRSMHPIEGWGRKGMLTLVILLDLASLCYFKYTNFVVGDIVNQLFSTNFSFSSVILPVGISFYTFQAISYAVDVYRHRFTEDVGMLEYLFYLTFFPLILAGPITRAGTLIPQLKTNKLADARMVWTGLFLIMVGLVKKNVIGDYLAQYNNWVFDAPTSFSGFEDLMALFGYTTQIYMDFSGYSDMSIGVASVMGFALPDNFNFPYQSLNLTDFWRRWHISLSIWFRDYLYIPMGGNKKGTVRMYFNNFFTMIVAGLWHGASWMFLIWGGIHGFGLMVHKFFSRQLKLSIPRQLNFVSWLVTYLYVTFAWSFFRARDLDTLSQLYLRIYDDFSTDYALPFFQVRTTWVVMLLIALGSNLLTEKAYQRTLGFFVSLPWIVKCLLLLVIVQLAVEFSMSTVQPFIYMQF